MPFDAHKNLAVSTVATAPGPATSGTTLTLASGEGARMPAVPFNATVWSAATLPTPTSAEIVRVTAMSGDQITAMLRAQESTVARAIVVGDLFAATITVKALADLESGVNFPQLVAPASVKSYLFAAPTNDGADNAAIQFAGGGAAAVDRGAMINVHGNEHPGVPGGIDFIQGNTPLAATRFISGAVAVQGVMHPSGGFSWGSSVDPGAGNVAILQDLRFSAAVATHTIAPATTDGADTASLFVCAGGAAAPQRGAMLGLYGNESAGSGYADLTAGAPSGSIRFSVGGGVAGQIHPSGGLSWGSGSASDPGGGTVRVGNGITTLDLAPSGTLVITTPGTALANMALFYNGNGLVGYIQTTGSITNYGTSSDARLKTDRGRATDPDVLRRTVIHDFVWTGDGTPGRGVFAQEAAAVAPFAVSVGTDDRDESGNLKNPWGVDYSKYVPDLIVGWQSHESEIEKLRAEVAALQGTAMRVTLPPYYGTTDPPPSIRGSSWFSRVRDVIVAWLFPKEAPCV